MYYNCKILCSQRIESFLLVTLQEKAFFFNANLQFMYQTSDSFTEIGKLSSTHGLDGFLNIHHKLKGKQPFKNIKFLFVELKKQSYIPFKIEQIKIFSEDDAIVKLESIENVEQAKQIAGKKIYLPTDLYEKIQPKELTMDFKGFILYNQYDQKVGIIEDIFESPGQLLASVILANGNEALVPLVEQWILHINISKKELTLTIPEGLIEVYL
jgi:16S rRNA processing protein RimM